MNRDHLNTLICSCMLASACCAWAQGTAFTYQGQLEDDGSPANGLYDITASVWDAAAGPSQVGPTLTNIAVEVVNGLFTVTLDFGGGVFTGPARWLEIGVQTNSGGGFTTLSPRTEITAAPYAIFAGTVGTVPPNSVGSPEVIDDSLTASDLAAGSVTSSEIAAGAVGTSEVEDGSLTTDDINLGSFDSRYVETAGDTMTGPLTTPNLTVNATVGIGTGSPADSLHLFNAGNEGDIMVENSFPFITLNKTSTGGNAGFLFTDGGANEGWLFARGSDDAIVISSTTAGNATDQLVLQRNQNVGVGTDAAFTDLTVNGSIGFTDAATPGIFIYESGSTNATKPVIVHSPASPAWGMFYDDPQDQIRFSAPGLFGGEFTSLSINLSTGFLTSPQVGVASANPYTTLTVGGSIGFHNSASPGLYMFESGSGNANKTILAHSPSFPDWGISYMDTNDTWVVGTSPTDATPIIMAGTGAYMMINTATRATGYELSVNGQIACEEVLVLDSGSWPDYVFEPDYALRSLEEVETHIKERRHLPGIPTATEVATTGISVGDMQKRMMEKIEELTLYVIEQNKQLTAQDDRIRQLEAQLSDTEAQ